MKDVGDMMRAKKWERGGGREEEKETRKTDVVEYNVYEERRHEFCVLGCEYSG